MTTEEIVKRKEHSLGSNRGWKLMHHDSHQPNQKARFALTMVEKWGMVSGKDGEEDSTGRDRLKLMSVEETVDRAIALSDAIFNRVENKGWMIEVGTAEEIEKELYPDEQ